MENKGPVLIICAHSDDQILGCGGTIAKYAKQGIPVYTIIMSYGEKAMPHLKEEFVIKTRVNETHRATEIIGGSNVFFLGLREGKFKQDIEETKVKEKILNIIEKYEIKKIFTHSSFDIDIPNRDHLITYKLVKNICKKLDVELYTFTVWDFFKAKGNLAKSIKLVEDISSTMKLKTKALHAYQTQFFQMSIPYIQTYIYSFLNGLKYGYRFAEVFVKEK